MHVFSKKKNTSFKHKQSETLSTLYETKHTSIMTDEDEHIPSTKDEKKRAVRAQAQEKSISVRIIFRYLEHKANGKNEH